MDSLVLGLRVIVSLGAVFGIMWLLQRRLRAGNPGLRARVLSVVARQSVGPKASVVVVDTDGRRFLLGVTEHGITVLHSAEAPAPVPDSRTAVGNPYDLAIGLEPDPTHDAVADDGEAAAPADSDVPSIRAAARQASFAAELRKETAQQSAGQVTGSVLEPATWRAAAQALRSGRRS
ncbi:flagellar biosynthetic protein FliO [Terrabacter carboxydivorans]|uniref:Flagellar protein n=1 Tax=Terrabacter carboxydivorans TaxID=619730 RepID=A0ABN3LFC8_9MICO